MTSTTALRGHQPTTAPVAPTEDEIRQALARAAAGTGAAPWLDMAATRLEDPIGWPATYALMSARDRVDYGPEVTDDGPSALWCSLTRDQAKRLRAPFADARSRAAERCQAVILEELTAAGVAFAQEHPEAPRPG